MPPVEHIFLQVTLQSGHWSAKVAAATDSIHHIDRDEVVDWFIGTEKELTLRCDPFNLFFHPLPSGQYALGVIYPAQQNVLSVFQKSQTLNVRILFISPKVLFDHGNHPITLFEAFRNQIPFIDLPLDLHSATPLSPLLAPASSFVLDKSLLASMQSRLGAMALAQLTQSLFNAESTLFTSRSVSALSVVSTLLTLLPIAYRPELTFSSDFFLTAKNSFRLSGVSKLQPRTLRLMKQWGVPAISLERSNKGSEETLDPWAGFVYRVLQTQNFAFLEQHHRLEHQFALLSPMESQPVFWDNLNEVGVSLNRAMLSGALPEEHVSATEFSTHSLEELRCVSAIDQMIPLLSELKSQPARTVRDQRLGDLFPKFREELSKLESYLVRGIFGDETALPKIKQIWSQLSPKIEVKAKQSIQESVIATIHAVLISLEGDTGQRLLRSSQLLELMMFFLCREDKPKP